jgi:hypothetical protein
MIREEKDLDRVKRLARRVKLSPADLERWKVIRLRLMARAVMRKFRCNDDLRRLLLGTNKRVLCYATQYDAYYGIGYTMTLARLRRDLWGRNYLGQILMAIRERLCKDGGGDSPGAMLSRTTGDGEGEEDGVLVPQLRLCSTFERSGGEPCKSVQCILCAAEQNEKKRAFDVRKVREGDHFMDKGVNLK